MPVDRCLNAFFVDRIGVANTLLTLGGAYVVIMLIGSRLLERPPAGRKPEGWIPPPATNAMITDRSVTPNEAVMTPQFALLWGCCSSTSRRASASSRRRRQMMQDMFHRTPIQAAAVVSLISVFNASGRIRWASGSDYASGTWLVFQVSLFAVFTMYGGGFATIPAFLADIFGPDNVGAIHGALLTAWSAAALAGPVIITELSNRAKAGLAPGADRIHIYDTPLQVLAILLAIGLVLTMFVRPLRHSQRAVEQKTAV